MKRITILLNGGEHINIPADRMEEERKKAACLHLDGQMMMEV